VLSDPVPGSPPTEFTASPLGFPLLGRVNALSGQEAAIKGIFNPWETPFKIKRDQSHLGGK
jgi:hypothetical protein